MLGSALCVIGFVLCFLMGRRALWAGFVAALGVGDFYGILRANIEQPASHFIFDAGALGLYLALLSRRLTPARRHRLRSLMPWLIVLIGWPAMLFFVPAQDPLVQLVGLRSQTFFIPFLLFGAMFTGDEMTRIARCVASLNCVVLLFALIETTIGIEAFYPRNAVDDIIYHSHDVLFGGLSHFRIPATFTSSAAFAGTMVISMPLLLGAIGAEPRKSLWRYLLLGAVALSAIGVFLAASRSAALFEILMIVLFVAFGRMKNIPIYAWIVAVAGVAWLVWVTPQMQRFLSLGDTQLVQSRVSSSVNVSFMEMPRKYPLGNGLGGGGSSIPYFLASRVNNEVALENEYGLIMLEEGLPGLALWLAFIFWLLARPGPLPSDRWYTGRRLARAFCALAFATAQLGNGMLSAIPQTAILMLYAGWIVAPQPQAMQVRRLHHAIAAAPSLILLQHL